jgi:uracil-DNA glycosylase family 4
MPLGENIKQMEDVRKQEELERLHKGIRRCRRCPLYRNRTHAVPGEGPVQAGICFIGEAPGKEEDERGRPFVGRSGKFLERLFDKTGLARNHIYITSSVKCRPPNNRTPRSKELEICKNFWLNRQILLIDPRIVVLLGKVPLFQVLGNKQNLDELHGCTISYNGRIYFITYHPAAAMRFPQLRRKITHDFQTLKKLLI